MSTHQLKEGDHSSNGDAIAGAYLNTKMYSAAFGRFYKGNKVLF